MADKIERAPVRHPGRVRGSKEFLPGEAEVEELHRSRTPQVRGRFLAVTYEYWAPFHYPNVAVEIGRNFSGKHPINVDGVEISTPPHGAITIEEEHPIVGVTVIGSACQSPGYVILHAEPREWKYPRTAIKMKVENLWGEHVRGWMWDTGVDEGWSLAGMSSARFDLPDSRKVTILGGSAEDVSAVPLGRADQKGDVRDTPYGNQDAHYCVRIIRVTVKEPVPW